MKQRQLFWPERLGYVEWRQGVLVGVTSGRAFLHQSSKLAAAAAIATVITACSSPGGVSAIGPASSQVTAPNRIASAEGVSREAASSYIYTSTKGAGVALYAYPQLSQLGSVSDSNAAAMCTDKHGNVYVAESGASKLTEYAAGTLAVMRTLDDLNYTPVSCAIDPISGDLAVANSKGMDDGKPKPGSIAIFKKASGSPKIYKDKSIDSFAYCGYDLSGDFYADGIATDGSVVLAKLLGQSLQGLPIAGFTIAEPGAVAWDTLHRALLVSDNTGVLYRFYVSGGYAEYGGYIALHGASNVESNVSFKEKFVAAATPTAVGVWEFPSGDGPKYTLDAANVVGVAFSTPK
ncbi:MAG TPA: hypothetical protein VGK84_07470 [Candidatus Tumulicola sp.]